MLGMVRLVSIATLSPSYLLTLTSPLSKMVLAVLGTERLLLLRTLSKLVEHILLNVVRKIFDFRECRYHFETPSRF